MKCAERIFLNYVMGSLNIMFIMVWQRMGFSYPLGQWWALQQ